MLPVDQPMVTYNFASISSFPLPPVAWHENASSTHIQPDSFRPFAARLDRRRIICDYDSERKVTHTIISPASTPTNPPDIIHHCSPYHIHGIFRLHPCLMVADGWPSGHYSNLYGFEAYELPTTKIPAVSCMQVHVGGMRKPVMAVSPCPVTGKFLLAEQYPALDRMPTYSLQHFDWRSG